MLSTSMETDNMDVIASLPSLLVKDAMTSDITTNMSTLVSVRNLGKIQQPCIYIRIYTNMSNIFI